jgi:hypothetical protein
MLGDLLKGIGAFISIVFKQIVFPLLPIAVYGFVVIIILTICVVIAGVGGSMLFYVIVFFYIKALLDYNPVLEARRQAEQAAMMQQEGAE